MLVLSRNVDEDILIFPARDIDPSMTVGELFADGPIRVKVVEVHRHKNEIRLGVTAPKAIEILRSELAHG